MGDLFGHKLGALVVPDHVVQLHGCRFIGRKTVFAHSDRSNSACVHHFFYAGFATRRKQIASSPDVVIVNILRTFCPESIIGCDVIDPAASLHASQKRNRIFKVSDGYFTAEGLNVGLSAGIACKDSYAVASADKLSHHMASYEACSAGYEREFFGHSLTSAN